MTIAYSYKWKEKNSPKIDCPSIRLYNNWRKQALAFAILSDTVYLIFERRYLKQNNVEQYLSKNQNLVIKVSLTEWTKIAPSPLGSNRIKRVKHCWFKNNKSCPTISSSNLTLTHLVASLNPIWSPHGPTLDSKQKFKKDTTLTCVKKHQISEFLKLYVSQVTSSGVVVIDNV